MEKNSELTFSKYGVYTITDSLNLFFPGIEIKIEKISENVFSYLKRDLEDEITEKKIPVTGSKLILEVAPIRPLNYPAKRTNYFYLEFESPVYLTEGSSATVFVQCPIEIGLFLHHESHKDSLDWITCDPFNSRFGLYGVPETGILCKYSKVPIVGSYDDSVDYFNGVIKINLRNELSGGHSVTKIVFPITDTSIYYDDSKAIFDSITGVLKKKLIIELFDVDTEPIQTNWTKSPTYEKIETVKRMDFGVD
ncbi:MAG: DUF432 domain-containing protein [Nitrosopumilaceae archaeon]|nr:DUF432 domain-containing protein [Nitrosopumilaceae archaeon]